MIFCIADIHSDKVLRRNISEVQSDGNNVLMEFVEVVLADQTPDKSVIIAGDATDSPLVSGATVNTWKTAIDALQGVGIPVYFIRGNHDKDDGIPMLEALGAINLHNKLVKLSGFSVFGLEFSPAKELREQIKAAPPCDLLVLHTPFEHLLSVSDNCLISLDDIPAHVKNVLAGDIHKLDITKLPNGEFASPGSLHSCAIDQCGPFGYVTFTGSFKFTALSSRTNYRFVVTSLKDLEIISTSLSLCNDQIKPMVELQYDVSLTEQVEQLKNTFPDKFIFLDRPYKADILSNIDEKVAAVSAITDISTLQTLPLLVDKEKEAELYSLLYEMLSQKNASVLKRYES